MYTKQTADDFRKHLKLDDNYTVDAMLAVGTWVAYAPDHLDYLLKALDELGIKYKYHKFDHPDLHEVYEFIIDGKILWFFAVMGTAVMHIYLHMGSLLGSKKNILVGYVGGLAKGGQAGDIIIPNKVLGNDNAKYYQRSNTDDYYYPNTVLMSSLQSRLPKDITVRVGTTCTCEMMLGESEEDVMGWSADGYLGVEMEAALVFAISKNFNIPAAAILSIGDNLIENITMLDDAHSASRPTRQKSRQVMLKAAIQELLQK